MSIEEMIRLAATEAMHSTVPEGFDWIEEYQQYYSRETRFFYDPNTTLFYHTDSMTYYTFNDDTREYEVHSCVAPTKWSSGRQRRRAMRCLGDTEFGKLSQGDVEVAEVIFDMIDSVDKRAELEEIRKHKEELEREREKERRKRSPERKRHRSSDRHRRHSRKRSRSKSRSRRSSSERHKKRKRSSERHKKSERHRRRSSSGERHKKKKRKTSTSPERERHRKRSTSPERHRKKSISPERHRKRSREREPEKKKEPVARHWTVEDIQRSLKNRKRHKKEEFKQVYFDEVTHDMYTNASTSSSDEDDDDGWGCTGDERAFLMAQEGFNQAPLLRIIDETRNLSVVTISEGFIGSAENADVKLRNPALPEKAVTFIYNEAEKNFSAFALDTSAGIKVNGNFLENGTTVEVSHGDYFTIGNESVRICMHYGANTCASCEPGLLLPVPEPEKETKAGRRRARESSRKDTMRKIMQSYGIHHSQVANYNSAPRKKATGPSLLNIRQQARPAVGIPNEANPYQNCAAQPIPESQRQFAVPEKPAPVQNAQNVPIKSDNVGFKLLKSMGWSEGQGLGKEKQGKAEPISSELKNDRKGLGSGLPAEPDWSKASKEAILDKTRERFKQLEEQKPKNS